MGEINVWDFPKIFKCITIDELLEKIMNGEASYLEVGRKYIPGDESRSFMEAVYAEKKVCINYTDKDHPITVSSMNEFHINKDYFKKYEKYIKEAFMYLYQNSNNTYYAIPKFMFSQKVLDLLLEKKDVSLDFRDIELSNKQIKQIKDHFIEAKLDGKKISSKYLIGYITHDDALKENSFFIEMDELNNCDYYNFTYFKDNTIFKISNYEVGNRIKGLREDQLYFKPIFELLKKIDKLKKPLYFKLDVCKRSTFEKYLKEYNFKNIKLQIQHDNYEYSYQEYIDEEKKLDELVKPIKNSNLSPFEKYLAVYNIVKNFKPYNENSEDKEQARYIRYILNNDYMVCVGYAKLLECLLDKVGINANSVSVEVDTSYDKGFDENKPEEISVSFAGHQRVVVNIDDDKYNIHGLYMSDPTWDNNLDKDYLNHSLMLFDNMITSKRMFKFNKFEPILCFHSFGEYVKQINYLINQEIKEQIEHDYFHGDQELINNAAFKNVASGLLEAIKCDKRIIYFTDLLKACNNQKEYEKFFTELGNYLLKRINNPIEKDTILKANDEVKKEINNMEINTARDDYKERDLALFPYEIPNDDSHDLKAR